MNHLSVKDFTVPKINDEISIGDMPGDKVSIEENHIIKATKVFPKLLECINQFITEKNPNKIVVSVCGGSGVGKSETAALFSYFLKTLGVKSYILSGDNYPHRIPLYNDAERLRMFRVYGIEELVKKNEMNVENCKILKNLQIDNEDANRKYCDQYSFMEHYIDGGINGLKKYLGTNNEIEFDKISRIIADFKLGAERIWLKRMGRTESDLWYENVHFKDVQFLFVEWTHGNNENLIGVDISVFLNSTPAETLAHRQLRNRDKGTDSAFIDTVLEVEQGLLQKQAKKATIIVTKDGEVIPYSKYQMLMGEK